MDNDTHEIVFPEERLEDNYDSSDDERITLADVVRQMAEAVDQEDWAAMLEPMARFCHMEALDSLISDPRPPFIAQVHYASDKAVQTLGVKPEAWDRAGLTDRAKVVTEALDWGLQRFGATRGVGLTTEGWSAEVSAESQGFATLDEMREARPDLVHDCLSTAVVGRDADGNVRSIVLVTDFRRVAGGIEIIGATKQLEPDSQVDGGKTYTSMTEALTEWYRRRG